MLIIHFILVHYLFSNKYEVRNADRRTSFAMNRDEEAYQVPTVRNQLQCTLNPQPGGRGGLKKSDFVWFVNLAVWY